MCDDKSVPTKGSTSDRQFEEICLFLSSFQSIKEDLKQGFASNSKNIEKVKTKSLINMHGTYSTARLK